MRFTGVIGHGVNFALKLLVILISQCSKSICLEIIQTKFLLNVFMAFSKIDSEEEGCPEAPLMSTTFTCRCMKTGTETYVLDCEVVAYDREKNKILPFQVNSFPLLHEITCIMLFLESKKKDVAGEITKSNNTLTSNYNVIVPTLFAQLGQA